MDEIAERLRSGKPAGFDMLAIMGRAGDRIDNATHAWEGEDTRPTLKLCTLTITAVEKKSTFDDQIFAPTILADGIEGPAADSLFAVRTPAYAISITNRGN